MACRLKLHELKLTPQRSIATLRSPTIQAVAVEQSSLTDCCPVQANRVLLGGGFGVDLHFIPGPFVYQIAIVDTAHLYGGATIANLNGALSADLDVVLFRLPTSRVDAVPLAATVAQVRQAVLTQPSWNPDEKQAVLSVMNALGSLRGSAANPVLGFIVHYERSLTSFGLDPGFF
jgi:hypothetical protein